MKYLLVLLLTGCMTPAMIERERTRKPLNWSPQDHSEMMYSCMAACGSKRFKSYEPVTGKCVCTRRR